jgi:hypothetical protein
VLLLPGSVINRLQRFPARRAFARRALFLVLVQFQSRRIDAIA